MRTSALRPWESWPHYSFGAAEASAHVLEFSTAGIHSVSIRTNKLVGHRKPAADNVHNVGYQVFWELNLSKSYRRFGPRCRRVTAGFGHIDRAHRGALVILTANLHRIRFDC